MRRIYLDCDGVLADFNAKFKEITGQSPSDYENTYGTKAFWKAIRDHTNFFGTLPLMPKAEQLYATVAHTRPIILTGCPFGNWAEHQKFKWRDKHFKGVPMVTCLSRNKKDYCQPGDILVDDTLKYRHLWEQAGGIFIHYVNAEQAIKDVQEYL